MRRVHSVKRWVRVPKIELVGGPGDGTIVATRISRIIYPAFGGHYCYEYNPHDTFANYRRAFFQGACSVSIDDNGDLAIIMI